MIKKLDRRCWGPHTAHYGREIHAAKCYNTLKLLNGDTSSLVIVLRRDKTGLIIVVHIALCKETDLGNYTDFKPTFTQLLQKLLRILTSLLCDSTVVRM